MNYFYIAWLKGELEAIEQWLSDKYPDGTVKILGKPTTSKQIELLKYKQYVTDEMEKTGILINPPEKTSPQGTETKKALQQTERATGADNPPPEISNPTFTTEAIPDIFNILKDYFPTQQLELEQLLKTGNDVTVKLLFTDNGNKLADFFKQLESYQFIKGCEKKELQKWICRNFQYKHRRKTIPYTENYLIKIISGKNYHCKNPIINIVETENGFKILPARKKQRE